MDVLEREVANYMVTSNESSAESLQAADRIVQAVNTSSVQANLLQLIQCMGEYLTSEDDLVRAKATGLLSHTLRHCDVQSLNEAAVSVLVDFYCDRFTDRACIPSLLEGLVALTDAPNFSGANAVTVASRIFERVEVQRFPQVTRNLAFRVFENLLQNHLPALKAINNEFVYGFTQAMDGEKDPRNLMCAFKLIKIIIDEFDIATHVEDIFEVTFCYFPITFRPPPDDPYGITADDLKQSLRQCLAATPHFARFAVPLLLEKLSSTSGSAKKDSMETLAACAPVYGASVFLPLIDEVFDALKVEVFHSTDPTLENSALHAIKKVVETIGYYGTGPAGDPTEKVLKPLVVECIANLKEPEFKNAKPAGRILRAAASASYSAANSIVSAVLPLLLRKHRETEVATRKKAILDVLLEFLEANKTLYGSADGDVEMDPSAPSPLLAYKDRLLPLCEASVMASNEYNGLRLSALKGLELMVLSKNFLDDNELGLAVQSFNKVLSNEADEELRLAALASLKALSAINGKYVADQTVPELANLLPETSLEKGRISYKQALTAFKTLGPFPTIFQAGLPALLAKFDVVCNKDEDSAYSCAILDTLLNILEAKSSEKHTDIATCMNSLVPHLISNVVKASVNGANDPIILRDDMLTKISLILMIVYENINASAQKEFADSMFKLFVNGDLSQIGVSQGVFAPLKQTSSSQQKATTRLFSAIICASRKEVGFPVSSLEAFLDSLVEVASVTECKPQLESVVRMIGSIINKWRDGASASAYVEKLSASLQSLVDQSSDQAGNALAVYLWVTKALVQKSSPQGMALADKVIAWCSNAKVGKEASEGFDILSGDDRLALNKAAFATITILHKQRFFNTCLPKLVEGFRSSTEDIKHNYLIALSYLLKNVPKQILLSELPPLAPLLIQSLSLPDTTLKVSTLDMFRLAITEAAEAITPHVRSIIPAILDLLDAQKNPMQVRTAALKCLAHFPSGLSSNVLVPHANYVIRQLGRSLDDKKRLVRKEAVDCRAKWYTVNV